MAIISYPILDLECSPPATWFCGFWFFFFFEKAQLHFLHMNIQLSWQQQGNTILSLLSFLGILIKII